MPELSKALLVIHVKNPTLFSIENQIAVLSANWCIRAETAIPTRLLVRGFSIVSLSSLSSLHHHQSSLSPIISRCQHCESLLREVFGLCSLEPQKFRLFKNLQSRRDSIKETAILRDPPPSCFLFPSHLICCLRPIKEQKENLVPILYHSRTRKKGKLFR
jgi:hypothetical protein